MVVWSKEPLDRIFSPAPSPGILYVKTSGHEVYFWCLVAFFLFSEYYFWCFGLCLGIYCRFLIQHYLWEDFWSFYPLEIFLPGCFLQIFLAITCQLNIIQSEIFPVILKKRVDKYLYILAKRVEKTLIHPY